MKGDFSRSTFNPQKNYRAVRMQQGRVLLDADWNEMVDIINHQNAAALHNLVGAHGGLGDGFGITLGETPPKPAGENEPAELPLPDLYIRPGQYYADGYLCTLADQIPFDEQPYFPGAANHKTDVLKDRDSRNWILYLDVWERHLTAIEDPNLPEPSLGGADTTTRSQVVWRVKMLPIEEKDRSVDAQELMAQADWKRLIQAPNISITRAQGYATENELFRVEVHAGGDLAEAGSGDISEATRQGRRPPTWKWSRDNASIAFPLRGIDRVQKSSPKKADHLLQLNIDARRLHVQLRPGDCVEIECDRWVLDGQPGWLGRVDQVEAPDENGLQRLMVTTSQRITNDEELAFLRNPDQHPLIRRWDQQAVLKNNHFHFYNPDKIHQLADPSHWEVSIPVEQGFLKRGDRVELSDIFGRKTWQAGQVQEDSVEGRYQKVQIALADPSPAQDINQPVRMRRWTEEANLYFYQADVDRIDQSQASIEILIPLEQSFLEQGDQVELQGAGDREKWREGKVKEVSVEGKCHRVKIALTGPLPGEKMAETLKSPLKIRWWNEDPSYHLYQAEMAAIGPLGQMSLEIPISGKQASLYQGDQVELMGVAGGEGWRKGQVQEVLTEGNFQKIQVTLTGPVPDTRTSEALMQPVNLRRWRDEANHLIMKENMPLKDGISVQFPPGSYQSGDYWLIPVRSGVNQEPVPVPPGNTVHAFAPLALLTLQDAGWEVADLRRVFLDLGEVSGRLGTLQTELENTKSVLASLQKETDIEYEGQEDEIGALQKQITALKAMVDSLAHKVDGFISQFPSAAWRILLVLVIFLLLVNLMDQSRSAAASQQASANAIRQVNQTVEAQQANIHILQTGIAQNGVAFQQANGTIEVQQAGINALQTAVPALQTAIPTPRLFIALNPASTKTVAVVKGDGSGTAFTRSCPPNFVVTGFSVMAENYVNAIQLWCSPLFEDGTTGSSGAIESFAGRQSGRETQLACQPNMILAEISGRSGDTTDRLQVTCASLNGVQKQNLQTVGGSGGDEFLPESCPANFMMTGITGLASARDVTRLSMICTAYVMK
jgi:hypothetical protein